MDAALKTTCTRRAVAGSAFEETGRAWASSRYPVEQRLGEGGMGEVWLCRDDLLARDVAAKRMRRECAWRDDLRTRFIREARVQARLEHPSIVPLYDLDVASGTPFFTMRRVHGSTLAEILDRLRAGDEATARAYSRHKLLATFAGVCLTVALAHDHGVVHRDLKPENIMLGPYGELYILDWGIAKIAEHVDEAPLQESDERELRTSAGTMLGTLGYMAPEQFDEPWSVDERSDVYALGAVLFEIVTLEPLRAARDLAGVVKAIRGGVDARPSLRVPGCDSTGELDAICEKATALAREDRYASVRELYDAVEGHRERDRDLEERRARASLHARTAEAAARDAEIETDPDAPRRVLALREASLALALDPANTSAADTVGRLLARCPPVLPAEVDRELEAASRTLNRGASRTGALLLASWFAYLPLKLFVGIRSVWLYVAVSLLFALGALVSYLDSRDPPPLGRMRTRTLLLIGPPIMALSTIFGPHVLVTSLAMVFAAGMILVARSRAWPVREIVTACAIPAVPIALDATGLIPPLVGFDGSKMLIRPILVELSGFATIAIGVTLALVAISIFAWCVLLRNALTQAERTLIVRAWHLRQLLKRETSEKRETVRSTSRTSPPPDDAMATRIDTGAGRIRLDAPLDADGAAAARYEVREQLRVAGEGEVLLCEDRRIGRTVAMKRVPADASDEDKRRLWEEARTRTRLQHPSVPPVYDAGVAADGSVYFTMRRPRGSTLAEAVALRHRSLRQLVEAFATACHVVEYAHSSGIGHRGLGPHSIVLGEYGEVYVTGWASASPLDGETGEEIARVDIAALRHVLAFILTAAAVAFDVGASSPLAPEGSCVPPELEAIATTVVSSAAELHGRVARFLEGERDLAQRKARALGHVELAEQALARALAGDDGTADRTVAMRAVSQALALEPGHARAASALMTLLTAPPRRLPPEAEREVTASHRNEQRRSARLAARMYLACLACLPLVAMVPGASYPLLGALGAAFLAAVATFGWVGSDRYPVGRESVVTVGSSMLCAALLGVVAGPLVLAPAMAIGSMITFVLQPGPRRRGLLVFLACLSFVGPMALQVCGILPPSYETLRDGSVAVLPHLFAFSRTSHSVLGLAEVIMILSACIFFTRFRDARNRAEERIFLHDWQLRQLLRLPP